MRILKWLFISITALFAIGFAIGYTPDTDPVEMRAKYGSAPSQFLTLSPGLTVHVRDQGPRDGQAVILIHGSNASLQTWEPWVARLQDEYRVISLDLPGHGLTGINPSGVYDYPSYAAVVDQVMQKLGIPSAIIAGNSMGGGVAWTYALAHPDKVAGLVLVDAAGAPNASSRKAPIGFRIARMPIIKEFARVIMPRAMFESSLKTSISNAAIITPQMVDRYWELNRYPGNREATMLRFAVAQKSRPVTPAQLAEIKAPVLILWGAEDNLIPVSSGQWFHKNLPGSKLIIYPKVGHIPMEEVPDRSAADLTSWVKGLAS